MTKESVIPSWAKLERYGFTHQLTCRQLIAQFLERVFILECIELGDTGNWNYTHTIANDRFNAWIPPDRPPLFDFELPISKTPPGLRRMASHAVRPLLKFGDEPTARELPVILNLDASNDEIEKEVRRLLEQWRSVVGIVDPKTRADGIDADRMARMADPGVLMALDLFVHLALFPGDFSVAAIGRHALKKQEQGGATMAVVNNAKDKKYLRRAMVSLGDKGLLDSPVRS